MKIGIFSDIHGNLLALESIIEKFNEEECDYIYCLGDILAIGPYQRECIDLLFTLPNIKFVMGNHEEYFVKGIDKYDSMSKGEKIHQKWVSTFLDNKIKEKISNFPYLLEENINNFKVAFMHYALSNNDNKKTFKDIEKLYTAETLDKVFSEVDADIIFYGHEHSPSHITGEKIYINVGSSGCTKDDLTHCSVVEFKNEGFNYKVHKIQYDKDTIIKEFIDRNVPEKEFIMKIFFGLVK